MLDDTVLSPLDSADLASQGLVYPGPTSESIRLHKRRLNRMSDREYESIPLEVPPTSPDAEEAFVTLPVVMVSYETLIYLGFSTTRATDIWRRWCDWPSDGPQRETDPEDNGLVFTFKDFIVGSIEDETDVYEDDDQQWKECLDRCGIDTELQEAIMDPRFKNLYLSQSCLYWVKDTIDMSYAALEDIQLTSRLRERALQHATTRPGRSDGSGGSGTRGTAKGSSSSAGHGQQQNALGCDQDCWGSASSGVALNAPGHTVLFKAIDQSRIRRLFDESGKLSHMEALRTSAPSDFSPTRALYYFTPDHKIAELYASYAKRRKTTISVVIVCIQIPNAAIQTLPESEIYHLDWPSDDWKELVWHSRRGKVWKSKMAKYQQATLLIGPTPGKPDAVFEKMKSFQEIQEKHLLKMGNKGHEYSVDQYVFEGEMKGTDFLIENGGKDIRVFPYFLSEHNL